VRLLLVLLRPDVAQRVARGCLIAGVLLLVPGGCTLFQRPSSFNADDLRVATTDVARLRLDSVRSGSTVRMIGIGRIGPQWKRLRQAWGDHGYVVYATTEQGGRWSILPFSELKLDLIASTAGGRLTIERPPTCPDAVTISETADCAVVFKPPAGETFEIAITATSPGSLLAGDLVVAPYWGGYNKDRIVSAGLNSEARPYINGMAVAGVVSLITSGVLGLALARRLEARE
jgi:hypothetical protein